MIRLNLHFKADQFKSQVNIIYASCPELAYQILASFTYVSEPVSSLKKLLNPPALVLTSNNFLTSSSLPKEQSWRLLELDWNKVNERGLYSYLESVYKDSPFNEIIVDNTATFSDVLTSMHIVHTTLCRFITSPPYSHIKYYYVSTQQGSLMVPAHSTVICQAAEGKEILVRRGDSEAGEILGCFTEE